MPLNQTLEPGGKASHVLLVAEAHGNSFVAVAQQEIDISMGLSLLAPLPTQRLGKQGQPMSKAHVRFRLVLTEGHVAAAFEFLREKLRRILQGNGSACLELVKESAGKADDLSCSGCAGRGENRIEIKGFYGPKRLL
jgi:hypothetical protein